jgi:DNA polymerase (family X)
MPGKTMSTTSDRLPATVLPLDNRRIAGRLEEVAKWLEAKHDNQFRVNAYRAAADTVRHLDRPVADILHDEGADGLEALPTIGRSLARTIETLARTGELHLLDRLRGESDPVGLLADVSGVGPELAKRIYEQLHIATLEELEIAAHDGRLATVPGVGPKRLRGIRDALAGRLSRRRRPLERPAEGPPVAELLEVDRLYRERAEAGLLRRTAPRRFNPEGAAWLPVMRLRRNGRRYAALYSNTALAHELGKTRDWVVIYCDDGGQRSQWTVVTAATGPCRGRRVVRGRERECADVAAASRRDELFE